MTDIYQQWTIPFFDSLTAAGVEQIVISPGSRSTPLALTALANHAFACNVVVDERSAAFFALGQIRLSGKPSVLICTSGSAGAHYFPAIVEAFQSSLPLIILTADRPWERQQCGTNQTVPQQRFFGTYTKSTFELGEPTHYGAAQSAVCRVATQAVFCAMSPAPGPVHINARFRKPLEPPSWPIQNSPPSVAIAQAPPPRQVVSEDGVQQLVSLCNEYRHGIIVCGPGPLLGDEQSRKKEILKISEATGFPIFAEAASSIKNSSKILQHGSTYFQTIDEHQHVPELIIEIHRPLSSSSYEKFSSQHPKIRRVVLTEDGYVDPSGTASLVLIGEIPNALERAAKQIKRNPSTNWTRLLINIDQNIAQSLALFLKQTPFCDATAIATILGCLSADTIFCLGNSMAIRDVDTFAEQIPCAAVLHQRGASGIDGLISGAAGTASCSERPVVLVLGDLSALHDLGGVALLKKISSPLVVVIINNDGGQIFNQLPIANNDRLRAELRRAFVLPGTPSFKGVCEMFQISYKLAQDTATLKTALGLALATPGATVVEAKMNLTSDFRKEFVQFVQSRQNAKKQ